MINPFKLKKIAPTLITLLFLNSSRATTTISQIDKNLSFSESSNLLPYEVNNTEKKNFLFFRTLNFNSTFTLGYGRSIWKKKNLSLALQLGAGVDIFSFKPPNINFFTSIRLNWHLNDKNLFFAETAHEFVFNPWFILNQEHYFPDCLSVICPEIGNTIVFAMGYGRALGKKFRLLASPVLNYDIYEILSGHFYLFGILQINYNL